MYCESLKCIEEWFRKNNPELINESTDTFLRLKWSVKTVEFSENNNLYVRVNTEMESEGYVKGVSVVSPEESLKNVQTGGMNKMLEIELESGEIICTSFA